MRDRERDVKNESPACTVFWVVVPFTVIGDTGRGVGVGEKSGI